MTKFDRCLAVTLRWEGGWSDHPRDPGGATMKGITLATYRQYRPGATKAQLRAITDAEVKRIYREGYWDKVRGDDLPAGLDMVAFDAAVNSGPARGVRWLQQALGVTADGAIGPQTIAAAQAANARAVAERACDIRLAWLKGLSTWDAFGRGWSNRVADVRREAAGMAINAQPEPSAPQDKQGPVAAFLSAFLAFLRRKQ